MTTQALERAPQRRGRWQLLGLLAVVIGPMLLASAMYHGQFWVPEGRSYHGELIANGQPPADLGVAGDWDLAAGEPPRRWLLLVTSADACAADCQALVYLAVARLLPELQRGITGNCLAHGLFLGGSALCAGLLNAACMVY